MPNSPFPCTRFTSFPACTCHFDSTAVASVASLGSARPGIAILKLPADNDTRTAPITINATTYRILPPLITSPSTQVPIQNQFDESEFFSVLGPKEFQDRKFLLALFRPEPVPWSSGLSGRRR